MKKMLAVSGAIAAVLLVGCATTSPTTDSTDRDAIKLVQSKRGAAVSVQERLLFDSGSASLRPGSERVLDRIADIVKSKGKGEVLVEGHTDNVGTKDFNQHLSEQRALSVKQALIARGVDSRRPIAKGYGFSEPVAPNDTLAGRQSNRRAEIVFPGETVASL
ncbi:MAG TPA: OmpA family protein, partial [Rhodocyclaceae bacterium]